MARCDHCERELDGPYFRFALALQGEVDSLGAAGTSDDFPALLAQLEGLDEATLEAQVHEELTGVLCPACRRDLRAFFGRRELVQ